MAVMDRDAQIMAEADKQRRHELDVAKIDAETKRAQAVNAREVSKSRHEMLAWAAGIGGVVAIILTIIISIANANSEDRAKDLKIKEQQNAVAETCIREGNIWLDGDCIPAQRES